jgi:hypothetical protein
VVSSRIQPTSCRCSGSNYSEVGLIATRNKRGRHRVPLWRNRSNRTRHTHFRRRPHSNYPDTWPHLRVRECLSATEMSRKEATEWDLRNGSEQYGKGISCRRPLQWLYA